MAFDKTPTTWIQNYSSDGTNITIPIASLPQLTAAEANAATGDIRKLYFALLDKLQAAWNAQAEADRPAKMTLSRSTSVNDQTGAVTRSYNAAFALTNVSEEVSDEA